MGASMDFFVSSTLGFFLKLAMAIVGAAFGLLGVGAKTRDESGRLTPRGRIALLGLISTAGLAVAAQVYDFYVVERKAEADKIRVQEELTRAGRLMLSVQRGIYPMRGLTADVELTLPNDNSVLTELRKRMRENFGKNLKCDLPSPGIFCRGRSLDSGNVFLYSVDQSSSLFPLPNSDAFRILRYLELFVALYRLGANGNYEYLGRFWISWNKEPLLGRASLYYHYDADVLSLHLAKLELSDNDVAAAGVYSLADLTPGAIAATVKIWDDKLCEDVSDDECQKLLHGLEHTAATELRLKFPFPKAVWSHRGSDDRCLVVALPADIEAIDALGNIARTRGASPPALPCADDR
jgi:hypothetical protein